MPLSKKSQTTALLLCLFLGGIGAHRFYTGKFGTAVLQMFTLGGFGIWSLIDFFFIITGNFKDKRGLKLNDWAQYESR